MGELLKWREEPIAKHHNRTAFDCGEAELNAYLKRYARQNHETGGAKTFVAVSEADDAILGYYSVTFTALDYNQVPEHLRRGLGRYEFPVYRLGRLAVDQSVQGQGLGGKLLMRAGIRCLRVAEDVGGFGLLIDAKNEQVANWYRQFGAEPLASSSLSLFLPLRAIASALEQTEEPGR